MEDHLNSQNIVARLNLVNMRLRKGQRIHAYGHAVRGLMTLESSWERQQKYIDFVEAYGALDEEERRRYRELYVTEDAQMMQWSERLLDQGEQRGCAEGGCSKGCGKDSSGFWPICWPSASVLWMRPCRRAWSKPMRRR